MNDKFYSNKEFTDIKNRINAEVLRRGGFKWADPLSAPKVGTDRTPPLSLPDTDPVRIPVDDRTYTINSSSEGSIEPTKVIHYPAHGENPAGELPTEYGSEPNTSAALFTVGEIKNFLVGLSKINDINLFYGRGEKVGTAFRDPNGIEALLEQAESDHLHQVGAGARKYDPVSGQFITFPDTNGYHETYSYMPSGEYEGEEFLSPEGLNENQFFDDYGAEPGDDNYHPINPGYSPFATREFIETNDDRSEGMHYIQRYGGMGTLEPNPRNPKQFEEYKIHSSYGNQYPLFQGAPTSCQNVCTGLCNVSCDEMCSESCSSTCTMRCGNACFAEGTLIDTIYGPIAIEDIKIGDKVLTQSGEYHYVYNVFKRIPEKNECIILKFNGAPKIKTTINHPFWVKKYNGRTKIKGSDGKWKTVSDFSKPTWVNAGDIKERDKVCFRRFAGGNVSISYGIAYMVGRYLGDGWKEFKVDHSRISDHNMEYFWVCCGYHETDDLEKKMDQFGIHYSKQNTKKYHLTAQKYHILSDNTELIEILRKCGTKALEKHIPMEIFDWSVDSMRALLDGYFDADGHYDPINNRRSATSVSKKLLYGISKILRIIGVNPTWSEKHYTNAIGTSYIQGRKVQVHDQYIISFSDYELQRKFSIFEDNEVWASARTPVTTTENYTVYNISVEDDPTYYADGILVHNCTSSCGNTCSGCASQCYTSCKTKCENSTGYSCVSSGVQAMEFEYGEDGVPQPIVSSYSCTGCSYSCQFYPNKKTTCWDSGCMGNCYTTCLSGCLSSCTGSCFGNEKEESDDYKSGKGQGCSSFCTVNCVGSCDETCEGICTTSCFNTCGRTCSNACENECSDTCDIDCGAGCSANCSDNCDETACTAKCSDACSSECTSCANTCGFECGYCSTECSANCDESCTFLCTENCTNSCEENCVHSCTDVCGGCSSLCFSCVGLCIGICAYKCENGCSSCEGTCTMWCDSTCSQECFGNCYNSCMFSCNASCAANVGTYTTNTTGPWRPPTSPGYHTPNPSNRTEEQDSFKIF